MRSIPEAWDLHCEHCGYSLTGLTENRCPECGRTFDVDALRLAAQARAARARATSAIHGSVLVVAGWVVMCIGITIHDAWVPVYFAASLIALLAFAIGLFRYKLPSLGVFVAVPGLIFSVLALLQCARIWLYGVAAE
jgi:hypothetical protein